MRASVTGNITTDPELKFTNQGLAVLNFTVADNYKRNKDADEEVTFIAVTLWGTLAENFSNSISKGNRVFVEGRVTQQNWETESGEKRSRLNLTADSAGPDLRFHTAVPEKAQTKSGGNPNSPAPRDEDFF